MIAIAYKVPAYTDTQKDSAALDVLSTRGLFADLRSISEAGDPRAEAGFARAPGIPMRVDPDLFTIRARVKRAEDIPYVRDQILETVKRFQNELVAADKLDAVKKRERYGFTLQLDNSESVAQTVARYVALQAHAGYHRPAVRTIRATDSGGCARSGAQVPGRERAHHRDA